MSFFSLNISNWQEGLVDDFLVCLFNYSMLASSSRGGGGGGGRLSLCKRQHVPKFNGNL